MLPLKSIRDGRLMYEGKVMPYEMGQEPDIKRLLAGGSS